MGLQMSASPSLDLTGTPSSYMIMCLEMSADADVDILFSEYNLNDGRDPNNRVRPSHNRVRPSHPFMRVLTL